MTTINEYKTNIDSQRNTLQTEYTGTITTLNSKINDLYESYHDIENETDAYVDEYAKVIGETTDFVTLNAKLDTSFQSRTYFLFILWCAIFFILLITLFINVVGDISDINMASKIILLCICLYMAQIILSNIIFHIQNNNGNSEKTIPEENTPE